MPAHVVAGVAFAVLAFHISWATFLWLSPIAGALMLSPLVSWATGLPEFGRKLWHWNVFRIPEEAPRSRTRRSSRTPCRPNRCSKRPSDQPTA